MSWSNKQKAWVSQVRKVARVSDEEYRETLSGIYSHCHSATDERLNNNDFSSVMAWLEVKLNEAVIYRIISLHEMFTIANDPWKFNRELLRKESSFQDDANPMQKSCEPLASQMQIDKIIAIKHDLHKIGKYYDIKYFNGVIEKATKTPCKIARLDDLTIEQASLLIDALQDRYSHAKFEAEEAQRELNLIPF